MVLASDWSRTGAGLSISGARFRWKARARAIRAYTPTLESVERGKIKKWDVRKGWGFIEPLDGGSTIFCHYSDLVDAAEGMRINDEVTFEKEFNPKTSQFVAKRVKGVSVEGRNEREKEEARAGPSPLDPDHLLQLPTNLYGGELPPQLQLVSEENICFGVLKIWKHESNYGFIIPEGSNPKDADERLFVHATKLLDGIKHIRTPTRCRYTVEYNAQKDRVEAANVKFLYDDTIGTPAPFRRKGEGDPEDGWLGGQGKRAGGHLKNNEIVFKRPPRKNK